MTYQKSWNELEISLTKTGLCKVWLSGSGEQNENVNSLKTDGQQTKGDQKSSSEQKLLPIPTSTCRVPLQSLYNSYILQIYILW